MFIYLQADRAAHFKFLSIDCLRYEKSLLFGFLRQNLPLFMGIGHFAASGPFQHFSGGWFVL